MYKSKNTTIKENNIPTGWREVKVGEVCKIKHGKSQKNVECSNGKYPILASGGLIGYANDFLYDKESVLIGRKGTIDKPQYMNTPFWTVDTLFYTEIRDDSFAKWLFYNFSHIKWKKYNEGSTVPSLTGSGISNIKILLPPLPEQEAIANTLEKWDEAIEKTAKLIEAKKRRFEWLLNNFFSSSKEKLKISDLLDDITIEKGKPLKKDQTAEGLIPVIAGGKISPYFHDTFTHNFPCITISASGAYAGYVAYHTKPIWASDCNVAYCKKASTEYLFYALKQQQNKVYSLQSGGGQPHIYSSDLKTLEIYWPELSQQKQIAKTLNTAKKEITILEEILVKYKSQKKGLMQKLLTGKVRVNNINSSNQDDR